MLLPTKQSGICLLSTLWGKNGLFLGDSLFKPKSKVFSTNNPSPLELIGQNPAIKNHLVF